MQGFGWRCVGVQVALKGHSEDILLLALLLLLLPSLVLQDTWAGSGRCEGVQVLTLSGGSGETLLLLPLLLLQLLPPLVLQDAKANWRRCVGVQVLGSGRALVLLLLLLLQPPLVLQETWALRTGRGRCVGVQLLR